MAVLNTMGTAFFFLSNFSKNDNSQWAQVLEILQTNEIFSGKLPY